MVTGLEGGLEYGYEIGRRAPPCRVIPGARRARKRSRIQLRRRRGSRAAVDFPERGAAPPDSSASRSRRCARRGDLDLRRNPPPALLVSTGHFETVMVWFPARPPTCPSGASTSGHAESRRPRTTRGVRAPSRADITGEPGPGAAGGCTGSIRERPASSSYRAVTPTRRGTTWDGKARDPLREAERDSGIAFTIRWAPAGILFGARTAATPARMACSPVRRSFAQ